MTGYTLEYWNDGLEKMALRKLRSKPYFGEAEINSGLFEPVVSAG